MIILVKILGVGLIVSVAAVALFWLIARRLLRKPNVTVATGTTWTKERP